MLQLQQQHPDRSDGDIMREVLGPRPGWERGIGPIPSVSSQPPPQSQRSDQTIFTQTQVEDMISARLASERQQWESEMMASMMSQMQSQIQTQVQNALRQRKGASQRNDESEDE